MFWTFYHQCIFLVQKKHKNNEGKQWLKGYKMQGKWPLTIFLSIISYVNLYNQPKNWHVECINKVAHKNICYTSEVHEHVNIVYNLSEEMANTCEHVSTYSLHKEMTCEMHMHISNLCYKIKLKSIARQVIVALAGNVNCNLELNTTNFIT